MFQRCERWPFALAGLLLAAGAAAIPATNFAASSGLAERVRAITSRPEFRHATFGIEFYDLDRGEPILAIHSQELFTPASTTKLLTEGAALELLGADYRFHTRIYRTGPLQRGGTLAGDLVLAASGDPNLSNRIQPDGTLAFENEDHCYGGDVHTRAVPGDPLAVLEELAQGVAARGIKRIAGRVLIDTSLFPEGGGELGTGTVICPIVVNDNIIDVTARPGDRVGAPVEITISPQTAYAQFINRATTGPANSEPAIKWQKDIANADGTRAVIVTGTMPLGKPSVLWTYAVPQPSRFAQIAFEQTLKQAGVTVSSPAGEAQPDFKALAANYTAANLVAEHISPPLSEDVRITLKVSQNLHASLMPYVLGAVLSKNTQKIAQAGFDLEHEFLERAGLDLSGASQSDGAGGSEAAFFTPDFVVHYLAFMAKQQNFPLFLQGLPVLGRDGTLWNIQTDSPAAGHVFAKTGTYGAYDALNRNLMITGKGLAGYFTTPAGRHVAFALYANRVAVPNKDDTATKIVGQALGEIAAAGYLTLSGEAASPSTPPARGDSRFVGREQGP